MNQTLKDQLAGFLAKMEAQKQGVCKKCGVEGTNIVEFCPPCGWKSKPQPTKTFKNDSKQAQDRKEGWYDPEVE